MAVITRTTAAATSSLVAERLNPWAPASLPNVGRPRFQFQAPSANTTPTTTSLAISAHP